LEWVVYPLFLFQSMMWSMISSRDIEQLIRPHLDRENIHLCELKVSGRAGRPLIQIFVDREIGNITVGACASISRTVQDLIDMQEWAPMDYQLVVSSPGVDWPMSELWQFRKNIGRIIRTTDNDKPALGRITEITADGRIRIKQGEETTEFTMAELSGARAVLEIPAKKKLKRKRNETRCR